MPIKILFFGDIVGSVGRNGLIKELPKLRKKYSPDLILANVENLAHGFGITQKTLDEMTDAGIDYFTSGNHIWKKKEGVEIISEKKTLVLRPENYPDKTPGIGHKIISIGKNRILLANLMGRVFFKENTDCPFIAMDKILEKYKDEKFNAVLVDFHAEATSEKMAFFHYLNGRVSAIMGTHTHVPTADLQISEKGTAYITDVGMTGPDKSVIGHQKEQIIKRFISQINFSHEVEEIGNCQINGVYLEIDSETAKTTKAKQILQTIEL